MNLWDNKRRLLTLSSSQKRIVEDFTTVLIMEIKKARNLGKKVKTMEFKKVGNIWEVRTWYE